jgi:hypothetical protein
VLDALVGDGKLGAYTITNGVETKEHIKRMLATPGELKYICSVSM